MAKNNNYPFYGGLPPHQPTATSQAAAASIQPHAASLRTQVLSIVTAHGLFGATREEIGKGLGMLHQTVNPRLCELEDEGKIYNSGQTRVQSTNRRAIVWIATAVAVKNRITPPKLPPRKRRTKKIHTCHACGARQKDE